MSYLRGSGGNLFTVGFGDNTGLWIWITMEQPREGPAPCHQLPQGDSGLFMNWHRTGMSTAGEKDEDSGVHAGTVSGCGH